jgi:hypothetical protein
MKILATLISAALICGCSAPVKPSIAIKISPASTREAPPENVAAARATMTAELGRRGFVVIRDEKSADYLLYTYYAPVSRQSSRGELVEVRKERNPMKERPLSAEDSLKVSPKITDEISGAEPPPR